MAIKLAIFDVDGTILQTYSWQYIHQKLGTWSQAKSHRDQFRRHQITYEEWAKLDVSLWKNQPVKQITRLVRQMPYTRGARETLTTLKQKGINIYLLSAGLTRVAERIQAETGIDGFAANSLLAKDGYLTGEVKVNVSYHDKGKHLPAILQRFSLEASECVAVGDDPTLIPLFKEVALAIAFKPANDNVGDQADITIENDDLRNVLPDILPSTAVGL
jgi:phosphoserine phosphatase